MNKMDEQLVAYMVRRDLDGEVQSVLRLHRPPNPHPQERWTRNGWVPDGSLEWSGIGGSSDWDPATPEEAVAALIELGASLEQLLGELS